MKIIVKYSIKARVLGALKNNHFINQLLILFEYTEWMLKA